MNHIIGQKFEWQITQDSKRKIESLVFSYFVFAEYGFHYTPNSLSTPLYNEFKNYLCECSLDPFYKYIYGQKFEKEIKHLAEKLCLRMDKTIHPSVQAKIALDEYLFGKRDQEIGNQIKKSKQELGSALKLHLNSFIKKLFIKAYKELVAHNITEINIPGWIYSNIWKTESEKSFQHYIKQIDGTSVLNFDRTSLDDYLEWCRKHRNNKLYVCISEAPSIDQEYDIWSTELKQMDIILKFIRNTGYRGPLQKIRHLDDYAREFNQYNEVEMGVYEIINEKEFVKLFFQE